ncbi:phosphopantetheine-binding protein [Desulfobacter sp.]|uniref:phosphopantetheine-binding protein n=1 Tax=Desulfobacter sp. TaxID=2294 RepID=UPI003D0C31C7
MSTFEKVREILAEILDFDKEEIFPDSYLMRELTAESIDLLEVALELSLKFQIEVQDDDIFLRKLRSIILDAGENGLNPVLEIVEKLPHLKQERVEEMLDELNEGPVLKVRDIVSYVDYLC